MTSYSVSSHSQRSRRSGDYVPSQHATYAQDYAPEYSHSAAYSHGYPQQGYPQQGYSQQGYPQQSYAGSHRRHSVGGGYREPYYGDASHYAPSSHAYSSQGYGHGHGNHSGAQYIVSGSGHRSHRRSPTYYPSSSSSRSHGHGHHREPYYVTSDTGHRHRSSSVSYARPGLADRFLNMLGVGSSSSKGYAAYDSGKHHSRGRRSGDRSYADARSGAEVDRRGRQVYTV